MKKIFPLLFILISVSIAAKSQKIDSIYFNLYTDSLKKGSMNYNYINVDGKLSDGRYMPLDSSQVKLTTSAGRLTGNVLQLDADEKNEFVIVTATLLQNPAIKRDIRIYIKRINTDEKLKTTDELLKEWNKKRKN